jgi:ATP-binding cassette subfamily F protein 3
LEELLMSLVSLENASVSFGSNDILSGIGCQVNRADRVGLVGRNGAGKTTLLRVLGGTLRPSSGRRHLARSTTVALVGQAPLAATPTRTVREEVLSGIAEVLRLERELELAADDLTAGNRPPEVYGEALERFEAAGGFEYASRFAQVLSGLGIAKTDWDKPLETLSGGQRSRVALAKALLAEPNLLLMDEPTNHLDLPGLQWLEAFLKRWRGTVIVASHDRYFLDTVATRIWHLDGTRLRSYRGNYTKFEALFEAEVIRQRKQHEAQQEFIQKEEGFIRRYRAGSRAREARGRAKKLARLEGVDSPVRHRTVRLELRAERGGELILQAASLAVGYGAVVLRLGDVEVMRGAHIALIGPNGSGKTTLLKTIAGELDPVEGRLRRGEGVRIGHYWQEAENLNPGSTVLQELLEESQMSLQDARDILGRFLFSGDDVYKPVGVLSGGEQGRLALARLVVSGANCLLLDEPTNHLDIPSRDALEQALASYPGTFMFASHDRRLIGRLASELWLIEDGRLTAFQGSFEEYNRGAVSQPRIVRPNKGSGPRAAPPLVNEKQKSLRALEDEIEKHEQTLTELSQLINEASERGDTAAIAELGIEFKGLEAEAETLIREWSELAQ